MHHPVLPVSFACIFDRPALPIRPHQYAGVARLASSERVEDRSVQLDSALVARADSCTRGSEIGIFAKQQFGQGHSSVTQDKTAATWCRKAAMSHKRHERAIASPVSYNSKEWGSSCWKPSASTCRPPCCCSSL